jgi:BirA family biotin operon repressor/biotin-[acetyl-CoA-carboxylase] ligase
VEEISLSPETITRGLNTRFLGQKVIYFPSVDSTMEAARREARWGAPAGTVVIADKQTAARGRLNRTWISPQGELALSIILRPNKSSLANMIMLASLAASFSIESTTGLNTRIKWPNDVLIKERKVCGILIENDIYKNNLVHTIIGIGINVNMHIPDFPEIAATATSLSDELGKAVSRSGLAQQLLKEMEDLYLSLPQSDWVFEQWQGRLITLGQSVQVTQGNAVYHGIAESVAKDGSLMLREEDGGLSKIVAGDVTLRKDF